ncbi:MAG: amino-acid N-acetyltransferase [Verrucomicrobiae bacterium]|nr:amino-acid N-acetyltransferase [Verrucomicrobiae bacterium]
MKPTDLRGILHYIPEFRDRIFVLAVDGAIVADDNFANILLDIAVLRSLNIHIVLVHGAGHQIQQLAQQLNQPVSNTDGTGVTDATTLRLAIMAANCVTHEVLEGLSLNNLRAAHSNCIEAVPLGIIKGVDHLHTGKVHQVDVPMLRTLLDAGIIPVIPPLAFDGNGHTYRLNSDAVASEVARALGAVKLMFLGPYPGLEIDGKLVPQLRVDELETLLKTSPDQIRPQMLSKAVHALRACQNGVPRVHLISGRVYEGILAEVFSHEGIGTLIYANEYEFIRPARRRDIGAILKLIEDSVQEEQLLKRTRADIEKHLGEYHVYEIDNNVVGVVAVHIYPEDNKAELSCLNVHEAHRHRGIGTKLALRAEAVAREANAQTIFALSTQAFNFFQRKLGYREGSVDDLPPSRRLKYEQSGRNSKILIKPLMT